MSVRLKHRARGIRAILGLSKGVQQAKPGDRCLVEIPFERLVHGVTYMKRGEKYYCGKQAHVVGQCREHMKAANRRRRP